MIKKLLLILNIFVALSLLLSYLAPLTSPTVFSLIEFFGLAYPFILGLNFLFVFIWLFTWKKQIFISLIPVLLGWNQVGKFTQIHLNQKENLSGDEIKIMSFNVRVFDLYNWTGNTQTRNKIFSLVKEESADILCFQEFFYSEQKNYFNTLDTLLQFQKAKFFHAEYTKTVLDTHHFGIATFSRFPIIKRGKVEFASMGNNICIFSDIKINNDTIRVYNAHLASLHFAKSDYKFLDEIAQVETGEQMKGIKQIYFRIKIALEKRTRQADAIALHISNSPYPVIFCGDFNDTPMSYAYATISNKLKDAFMESGNGFGTTYIGKFSPFRIDYILHSKSLGSSGFETIPEELSDHYPISCNIRLTDETKK